MNTIRIAFIAISFVLLSATGTDYTEVVQTIHSRLVGRHLLSKKDDSNIKPVQDMIDRVLKRGGVEISFQPTLEMSEFELKDGISRDVFEIDGDSSGVIFRGSTTVALASAFGHYMKYYVFCDFHWENGGNYSFSAFPSSYRTKDFSLSRDGNKIHWSNELHFQTTWKNRCS